MKKATYTLTLEYHNGDKSMRGGLTQTDCYRILGMRKAKGWTSAIRGSISLDESIVRWKIDTGWKEIEF